MVAYQSIFTSPTESRTSDHTNTEPRYRDQCISILSHLWNGGANESPVGVATTGSSEAILLAGLAMKRAWEESKAGAGRRPNVVVGSNVHLCVLKFTNYFAVEARVVPVNARSGFVVDPEEVRQKLDQNTGKMYLLGYSNPTDIPSGSLLDPWKHFHWSL